MAELPTQRSTRESLEPDSMTAAAEQGTVAHALAERKLRRALHAAPTFKPKSDWIDPEMESLTDDYISFVQEHISLAREACGDPQVLIEQRLDFSHVVPGGFGTGVCVFIAEPKLQIIDLKYGQGVLIQAEHNPQLMLYALGAIHAFWDLYDIETVAVTIYQPRRGNIDTWETSVADLESWAETVVKPKADLTDAEIADVPTRIPQLKTWATDMEAYALSQAVNQGKHWDGFKLIAGRSVRKNSDETKVAEAAEAAGYSDIYDRKLITLTAMERLMGKSTFTEMLGDLVVKPVGKPTLVPESDKRPALDIHSAQTEFKKTESR
ncbi:MAG: DUF2800 domain-containing protein [Schaalia turicensis]|nr:DUF2800 domain-containing protein [Schaalia turicensis]